MVGDGIPKYLSNQRDRASSVWKKIMGEQPLCTLSAIKGTYYQPLLMGDKGGCIESITPVNNNITEYLMVIT